VSKHQLDIRLRVLTDWMNYQLHKRGILVLDTLSELSDGKILLHLIEILCQKKCPVPSESLSSTSLLQSVLNFFHTEGGVLPPDFHLEGHSKLNITNII
jgi:hypothetical protein